MSTLGPAVGQNKRLIAASDRVWRRLRAHAGELRASRPGKAWSQDAQSLIGELGEVEASARLVGAFDAAPDPATVPVGLVWLAGLVPADAALAAALGRLAERSYRRVPLKGIASVAAGNACVNVLVSYGLLGAPQLSMVLARSSYPSACARVERALEEVGRELGLAREDVEEINVPDFGLDQQGERAVEAGEASCAIRLNEQLRVELRWRAPDGRLRLTPPAAMRRGAARDSLAELRALRNDIQKALTAQSKRIESLMSEERTWPLAIWRTRYLEHPLVGQLAKRLFWVLNTGSRKIVVIPEDGKLRPVHGGRRLRGSASAKVSLWSPLDSDHQTVIACREQIERAGLRQPFRQAHREVFAAGQEDGPDPSRSMRFAGAVVRQAQFAALCRGRGWSYTQQGPYFSVPLATKELPRHGLVASLEVPGLEIRSDMGPTDRYVTVGALSFSDTWNGKPLPLTRVPPRVFSEASRDVALFALVARVADVPDWDAAPPELRHYYEEIAFGPLSEIGQIRRDFLTRAIPRLPRPERLSLDDRSLVVKGELHTYRVHLDTADVLIAPDGPPVLLGEESGRRRAPELAMLPFEDATLELVLTAAHVLADDGAIEDPFVRLQVQWRSGRA